MLPQRYRIQCQCINNHITAPDHLAVIAQYSDGPVIIEEWISIGRCA